jgi:hypothetical protein
MVWLPLFGFDRYRVDRHSRAAGDKTAGGMTPPAAAQCMPSPLRGSLVNAL